MNAKKAKQLRRVAREKTKGMHPIAYGQTRADNYVVTIDSTRGFYRELKKEAKRT